MIIFCNARFHLPNTTTTHNSGNGYYVDGNDKILIGSGSGDRIQFNDGTDFVAQVGSLELEASNIEISSTTVIY